MQHKLNILTFFVSDLMYLMGNAASELINL